MASRFESGLQELNHRSGGGIDVALLWEPHSNRLFVVVDEGCGNEPFQVDVDAGEALEAFYHPYAYADSRREPTEAAASPLRWVDPCLRGRSRTQADDRNDN